jgi:hypothetical protein
MPENSIAHRDLGPEGEIEAGVTFRVTAEGRVDENRDGPAETVSRLHWHKA